MWSSCSWRSIEGKRTPERPRPVIPVNFLHGTHPLYICRCNNKNFPKMIQPPYPLLLQPSVLSVLATAAWHAVKKWIADRGEGYVCDRMPNEVIATVVVFFWNGLPDGQWLISCRKLPFRVHNPRAAALKWPYEMRGVKQSRCLWKSSSFRNLPPPYSGGRARWKLPRDRGQSKDLIPRYFERRSMSTSAPKIQADCTEDPTCANQVGP